jgi:hypothetical protein
MRTLLINSGLVESMLKMAVKKDYLETFGYRED